MSSKTLFDAKPVNKDDCQSKPAIFYIISKIQFGILKSLFILSSQFRRSEKFVFNVEINHLAWYRCSSGAGNSLKVFIYTPFLFKHLENCWTTGTLAHYSSNPDKMGNIHSSFFLIWRTALKSCKKA